MTNLVFPSEAYNNIKVKNGKFTVYGLQFTDNMSVNSVQTK